MNAKPNPAVLRRAALKQRALQKGIEQADKRSAEEKPAEAMQAGARRYPEPPFPPQHQAKPGQEALLDPVADVRRAVLPGLGKARRPDCPDYGR